MFTLIARHLNFSQAKELVIASLRSVGVKDRQWRHMLRYFKMVILARRTGLSRYKSANDDKLAPCHRAFWGSSYALPSQHEHPSRNKLPLETRHSWPALFSTPPSDFRHGVAYRNTSHLTGCISSSSVWEWGFLAFVGIPVTTFCAKMGEGIKLDLRK